MKEQKRSHPFFIIRYQMRLREKNTLKNLFLLRKVLASQIVIYKKKFKDFVFIQKKNLTWLQIWYYIKMYITSLALLVLLYQYQFYRPRNILNESYVIIEIKFHLNINN